MTYKCRHSIRYIRLRGGTLTITLKDLAEKGVFEGRSYTPPVTYKRFRNNQKTKFHAPNASQLFTSDEIADFVAIARGRIIAAFVYHTAPHRGKNKPLGYITGVDCKLRALVEFVAKRQKDRPIVAGQQLPEQLRNQTSGKIRQVMDSLTREFITMAICPMHRSQDIWFMWQNGGEWHIAPHCINELPQVKSRPKCKTTKEDPAA